jgi:hypothetical protein
LSILIKIFFFIFFSFSILILINRFYVSPTTKEVKILNNFFDNREIINNNDIIYIQNKVINTIKHNILTTKKIDIQLSILLKKGFCYDRSLILQKYLISKGIKVRPVYLFIYKYHQNTRWFHFFYKNLHSHNIFEFYFKGKWYVMKTNQKITKLETLESYLNKNNEFPYNALYVRYLFCRNSSFIYPYFIPDIYFF